MNEFYIKLYFTPKDLYHRYQITSSTLDRWIRFKNFPKPLKVGRTRRFKIEEVKHWEKLKENNKQ